MTRTSVEFLHSVQVVDQEGNAATVNLYRHYIEVHTIDGMVTKHAGLYECRMPDGGAVNVKLDGRKVVEFTELASGRVLVPRAETVFA